MGKPETSATWTISRDHAIQFTADITTTETDENGPWTVHDWITATRHIYRSGFYREGERAEDQDQAYWLICGDNMGSQQLVVWPHHIDALIDLLHELKRAGGAE